MAVIGTLDAGLRGARPYKAGGFGPFFRSTWLRERYDLRDFLLRVSKALERAELTTAVSLFLDDLEVYQDPGNEETNLEEVIDGARKRPEIETASSFQLMVTHVDEELAHVIAVDATIDHRLQAPAITVIDIARPVVDLLDDDEEESTGDEVGMAGEGDEQDDLDEAEVENGAGDDEEFDDEAAMEEFMQLLLRELDGELHLSEPELEVRVD